MTAILLHRVQDTAHEFENYPVRYLIGCLATASDNVRSILLDILVSRAMASQGVDILNVDLRKFISSSPKANPHAHFRAPRH